MTRYAVLLVGAVLVGAYVLGALAADALAQYVQSLLGGM